MTEKSTYALLIYRANLGEPPRESSEQALEGHRALQQESSATGDLHSVAKLAGVDTAKTVRGRAGAHDVMDGPYIDTKEWLVGFYLVDCSSEEEALSRARTICPVDDHVIEVRPVSWRWKP